VLLGTTVAHDGTHRQRVDEEFDAVRDATNYPGLLNAWFALAGHATAAADHPTDLSQPPWFDHLLERRRLRRREYLEAMSEAGA
jgi:hypothetical protein